MRVVLVADREDRDLGVLGDFLTATGATTRYIDRSAITATEVSAHLVVLLGSNRSAHDPSQAATVAAEVGLIRRSLALGIPVVGICYGAQVLARALGGSSRRGQLPECGWTEVLSDDHDLCPPGFWGQMHRDVIEPAPSSIVIGWSPAGPQAFIDDSLGARSIGWQFHPELVPATLERWLSHRYSGSEGSSSDAVGVSIRKHAAESAERAPRLFHAAIQYLEVSNHVLGVD